MDVLLAFAFIAAMDVGLLLLMVAWVKLNNYWKTRKKRASKTPPLTTVVLYLPTSFLDFAADIGQYVS